MKQYKKNVKIFKKLHKEGKITKKKLLALTTACVLSVVSFGSVASAATVTKSWSCTRTGGSTGDVSDYVSFTKYSGTFNFKTSKLGGYSDVYDEMYGANDTLIINDATNRAVIFHTRAATTSFKILDIRDIDFIQIEVDLHSAAPSGTTVYGSGSIYHS